MLGLNEFQAKSDAERLWIKIFNKAVKLRSENRQLGIDNLASQNPIKFADFMTRRLLGDVHISYNVRHSAESSLDRELEVQYSKAIHQDVIDELKSELKVPYCNPIDLSKVFRKLNPLTAGQIVRLSGNGYPHLKDIDLIIKVVYDDGTIGVEKFGDPLSGARLDASQFEVIR